MSRARTVVVVLALAAAAPAPAKVANQTLRELTDDAAVVVVGTVIDVVDHAGTRCARVAVERALKGDPPAHVAVVTSQAPRTDACDVSWATQGERAVYFLEAPLDAPLHPPERAPALAADPVFRIGQGGRARFPLTRRGDGAETARLPVCTIELPTRMVVAYVDAEYAADVVFADLAHEIGACAAADPALRAWCASAESTTLGFRGPTKWRDAAHRAFLRRMRAGGS